MSSEIIHKILNETPLSVKVRVTCHIYIISMLADMGYIDGRMWTDSEEDNKTLSEIEAHASKLSERIMEHVNDLNNQL